MQFLGLPWLQGFRQSSSVDSETEKTTVEAKFKDNFHDRSPPNSSETNLTESRTNNAPRPELVKDPNLVDWDSEEDPNNPKYWTMRRKWAATLIVSSFSFISSLSSSTVSPSLSNIGNEFHISDQAEQSLVLSVFTLGYSFGPFVLSPICEIYGRLHVLQLANLWFILWNLACGFAQTKTQLIIFRLLAGFGSTQTVGAGVLSDVWLPHQRGRGVAVNSLAPVLGPSVGPIIGGWIAQKTTWRWGFWANTIANIFVQLCAFICLRETYAPRLLRKKAKRMRRETFNTKLHTKWDDPEPVLTKLFQKSFTRPWKLMFTQPIIQVLSLYNAYNYGLLYLFITTYSTLWKEEYGESPGIAGLNYISLALGSLLVSQTCGPLNDKIYKYLKIRYGYAEDEEGIPEFRLPLMLVGAVITPIGLFWYGWSAQAKTFWLIPNIGIALYSAGSLIGSQCIRVYLLDAYTSYTASAFAATTFLRSLATLSFPLFAPYLRDALGYGWEGTLLGCIAIALGIPPPLIIWKYGARIRAKSQYCAGNTIDK